VKAKQIFTFYTALAALPEEAITLLLPVVERVNKINLISISSDVVLNLVVFAFCGKRRVIWPYISLLIVLYPQSNEKQ
jgi:hypothetical protein